MIEHTPDVVDSSNAVSTPQPAVQLEPAPELGAALPGREVRVRTRRHERREPDGLDTAQERLALDMAKLGEPRWVTLPWWQQAPPDGGGAPLHAFVSNRHDRLKFYAERRPRMPRGHMARRLKRARMRAGMD